MEKKHIMKKYKCAYRNRNEENSEEKEKPVKKSCDAVYFLL